MILQTHSRTRTHAHAHTGPPAADKFKLDKREAVFKGEHEVNGFQCSMKTQQRGVRWRRRAGFNVDAHTVDGKTSAETPAERRHGSGFSDSSSDLCPSQLKHSLPKEAYFRER